MWCSYMYVCMYVWTCPYICIYGWMFECMYIYVCMYGMIRMCNTCMYCIHVHVCMCIYVCMLKRAGMKLNSYVVTGSKGLKHLSCRKIGPSSMQTPQITAPPKKKFWLNLWRHGPNVFESSEEHHLRPWTEQCQVLPVERLQCTPHLPAGTSDTEASPGSGTATPLWRFTDETTGQEKLRFLIKESKKQRHLVILRAPNGSTNPNRYSLSSNSARTVKTWLLSFSHQLSLEPHGSMLHLSLSSP